MDGLVSATNTVIELDTPPPDEPKDSLVVPLALLKIARCESGDRQFDDEGNVIRGLVNSKDIGRFQINLDYWGEEATRLGLDIFTLEGNTEMALWIFSRYGTVPWEWSRSCWGK